MGSRMAGFSLKTCTTKSKINLNNPFTASSRQSKGAGLGVFVVKDLLETKSDYHLKGR